MASRKSSVRLPQAKKALPPRAKKPSARLTTFQLSNLRHNMSVNPYLSQEEKEIAIRALDKTAERRASAIPSIEKLSKHPATQKGLLKNLKNDESATVRIAAKRLWLKLGL